MVQTRFFFLVYRITIHHLPLHTINTYSIQSIYTQYNIRTMATSTNPSTLSNPPPAVNPPTSTESSTIKVLTTQPLLEYEVVAKPITSERLLIRPFNISDFFAYHSLVSQPEPKAF